MRDPFVLSVPEEKKYYLFGTTDPSCWKGPFYGFDCFISEDLEYWQGPVAAFRPREGFWGTENFWAPEVHRYRGKYYMLASFKAVSYTHLIVRRSLHGGLFDYPNRGRRGALGLYADSARFFEV